MNLLVTHRELDMAGYYMLEALSQKSFITIYITATEEEDIKKIKGNCIPLVIPALRSKVAPKAISAIRKIIKQYKIDIIFSPSSAGLSNALVASVGTKSKNLGYRGTQAKVRRADFTYYLGVLNPRLDHLICATQDIKDYLSNYIKPHKLTVLPKPFDVSWVEEALRHPEVVNEIPEGAFKVINIASHKGRPFKGLTNLLRAFYLVDDPRLHLTIVGDYDDTDFEYAKKGIDENRIHFLGPQNNAVRYIPVQDLLVLPSLRDAAPRVVKEAMACGVPCIVTDIPGARDFVENNVTGILCPPDSPEKMAEAIKTLMSDENKRLAYGKAGKELIINKYSLGSYINSFTNVINSL